MDVLSEGGVNEKDVFREGEREERWRGALWCSCLPADVPIPPKCQPDPPSAHPRTQALCLGHQIGLLSLSFSSPFFNTSSPPSMHLVSKFSERKPPELKGKSENKKSG